MDGPLIGLHLEDVLRQLLTGPLKSVLCIVETLPNGFIFIRDGVVIADFPDYTEYLIVNKTTKHQGEIPSILLRTSNSQHLHSAFNPWDSFYPWDMECLNANYITTFNIIKSKLENVTAMQVKSIEQLVKSIKDYEAILFSLKLSNRFLAKNYLENRFFPESFLYEQDSVTQKDQQQITNLNFTLKSKELLNDFQELKMKYSASALSENQYIPSFNLLDSKEKIKLLSFVPIRLINGSFPSCLVQCIIQNCTSFFIRDLKLILIEKNHSISSCIIEEVSNVISPNEFIKINVKAYYGNVEKNQTSMLSLFNVIVVFFQQSNFIENKKISEVSLNKESNIFSKRILYDLGEFSFNWDEVGFLKVMNSPLPDMLYTSILQCAIYSPLIKKNFFSVINDNLINLGKMFEDTLDLFKFKENLYVLKPDGNLVIEILNEKKNEMENSPP
ncbi:hypothetical protein HK099_000241, partial [Clydaea vesicula]